MAEPTDFGNTSGPSAATTSVTRATFSYNFGDLPTGSTLDIKLTVNGSSQTKTLTVPANKTAKFMAITIDGILV